MGTLRFFNGRAEHLLDLADAGVDAVAAAVFGIADFHHSALTLVFDPVIDFRRKIGAVPRLE